MFRGYLEKATGLSRARIASLIRRHRDTGHIGDRRRGAPARPFERRYTDADIRLSAEVDEALNLMSGAATRVVMKCPFEDFGEARFERLASISNGHLCNLRGRAVLAVRRLTRPRRAVARRRSTNSARYARSVHGPAATLPDSIDPPSQYGTRPVQTLANTPFPAHHPIPNLQPPEADARSISESRRSGSSSY